MSDKPKGVDKTLITAHSNLLSCCEKQCLRLSEMIFTAEQQTVYKAVYILGSSRLLHGMGDGEKTMGKREKELWEEIKK